MLWFTYWHVYLHVDRNWFTDNQMVKWNILRHYFLLWNGEKFLSWNFLSTIIFFLQEPWVWFLSYFPLNILFSLCLMVCWRNSFSVVFPYLIYALSILQVRCDLFQKIPDPPKFPEKILFCGWRRDIDDMIMVIWSYILKSPPLPPPLPQKKKKKKFAHTIQMLMSP